MKAPPGSALLLLGSGLYWVLAGPLIGWFSVFNPVQIRLSQLGLTMILVTGITCLVLGLWIIPTDILVLRTLLSRSDGWIFAIPIVLVVADIYLTLVGLSRGSWELNPYVDSAVKIGPWAVIPFVVSYMALSEGLALTILSVGRRLFGVYRSLGYMPFALICGAASLGPLNNLILLTVPGGTGSSNGLTALITCVILLSVGILLHFRRIGA